MSNKKSDFYYALFFKSLKLVSRLPFWCLHRISDFLYFVLYYLVRYRKNVIATNIRTAFPNNTAKENKKIAKKFVRHFGDFLMETLKTLSISEKQLQKRYKYHKLDLIQDQLNSGKNVMVLAAHMANWEWIFYASQLLKGNFWTAYSPLKNAVFDKLMVNNRERYGFKVVPSKKVAQTFVELERNKKQYINCLMSDQSPLAHYKYRAVFLGQDVPFFIGPEVYSTKYNLSVFYLSIKKVARSKYEAELIPITINPQKTEKGWITSEYIRLMEQDIKNNPEYYLWSHRRFKHAKKTAKAL